MALLNHQKTILKNLQQYRDLFIKEIIKSLKWLTPMERKDLELWLTVEMKQNFDSEVKQLFTKFNNR